MRRGFAAAAVLTLLGCGEMFDDGENPSPITDTKPRFDPGDREGWPELLTEWADKAENRYEAPTLSAAEVAALGEGVLIVDVRELREIGVSRIPNSMPLTSQVARLEFIRKAGDRTVVVYCTVGWRAAEYTQRLVEDGIDAYNLDGGICAWAAAGQPLHNSLGLDTTEVHVYKSDFAGALPDGYEPIIRP